jgi:hypothetical protein
MLSERDVEYVYRRSGIKYTGVTPAPKEIPTDFKVKGFDWLQFFIDCGIESKNAIDLGTQCVKKLFDEIWLDSVTRDKIKSALVITDGDALLMLQGITKRKLKRLEQIGQDRLLANLANPASANVPKASMMIRPLSPTLTHSSKPTSLSTPMQPLQPTRNVKNIPVLQPQNTLSSVQMPSQPIFKEFSTAGQVALPNGQFAQQHTTTQYMLKRSSRDSMVQPMLISGSNGTGLLSTMNPAGFNSLGNASNPLGSGLNPLGNGSNPSINMSNPLMGISNPLANVSNPLTGMPNPLMGMSNPPINMSNPLMGMSNPPINMLNPLAGMSNPPMNMSNFSMNTSNPSLNMQPTQNAPPDVNEDRYSIFKSVDPRSSSVLPQQPPRPQWP